MSQVTFNKKYTREYVWCTHQSKHHAVTILKTSRTQNKHEHTNLTKQSFLYVPNAPYVRLTLEHSLAAHSIHVKSFTRAIRRLQFIAQRLLDRLAHVFVDVVDIPPRPRHHWVLRIVPRQWTVIVQLMLTQVARQTPEHTLTVALEGGRGHGVGAEGFDVDVVVGGVAHAEGDPVVGRLGVDEPASTLADLIG